MFYLQSKNLILSLTAWSFPTHTVLYFSSYIVIDSARKKINPASLTHKSFQAYTTIQFGSFGRWGVVFMVDSKKHNHVLSTYEKDEQQYTEFFSSFFSQVVSELRS